MGVIPLLGHINNLLGFITYLLKPKGVLPKPTRNQYLIWGSLQTPWVQLFWFELLEGYCHSYDILGAGMLWKPEEARILKNFINQRVNI
jgi:hypothetical protein